jgi:hypothetical protein
MEQVPEASKKPNVFASIAADLPTLAAIQPLFYRSRE